jgi:hypothetical protein
MSDEGIIQRVEEIHALHRVTASARTILMRRRRLGDVDFVSLQD